MENSRSRSVFVDIGLRELNGFRGIDNHTSTFKRVAFFRSFSSIFDEFQLLPIVLIKLFYLFVPVRKRPFFADSELTCREIAAVAVEHEGIRTPPLAVSFCKV